MHRSVTDLSCNLSTDVMSHFGGSMEILKEHLFITEIELLQMGKRLVMIVVLSNDKIMAY